MKALIPLVLIALFLLSGCSADIDVEIISCAPKNFKSEYWSTKAVQILKDVKIPGTKERKVDHIYLAAVKVEGSIDEEKFLLQRGRDGVISSCLNKSDNDWVTYIFTDDPNAAKKLAKELKRGLF